jgi:hypothetical protein
VEALRTPNKKRYLIFVAVAGTHALVIGVLINTSRLISQSSPTTIPITAFLLTRPARSYSSLARPRLNETSLPPIAEPIRLPPPALPVIRQSGLAIDWNAEVGRSAAKILEPSRHISFGFPAGGKSAITLGVPSPSSPHYTGEQYRAEGGEQVYWLNDRCYMVSDPPSLFEPDFLHNARLARIGCN